MKGISFVIFLIALGFTANFQNLAQADEGKRLLGDRFSVDVGYKTWVAKWKTASTTLVVDPANPTRLTEGPIQELNSRYSVLHGPTITAGFKIRDHAWFHSTFVNFTWLQGSFDFRTGGSAFNNNSSTVSDGGKRRDYSIVAGLGIYKGIGIYVGYYDQKERFEDTSFFNGTSQQTQSGGITKIQGPIFGLYGNALIAKPFSFYSNLAIASLDQKFQGGGTFKDTIGYSAEFGLTVTGPRIKYIGTALQVGFRSQFINSTFTNNAGRTNEVSDITWGPIFNVLARF